MSSLGAALGFNFTSFTRPLGIKMLTETADRWDMSLDIWHLPFLLTLDMLFSVPVVMSVAVYATLAMLPFVIVTWPIAALAAVYLKTGRLLTTLYGALVGLFVGLPLTWAVYGSKSLSEFLDASWATVALMAGALFAQPIWAWCIKPRTTPAAAGVLAPRPRSKLPTRVAAWLALPAAYLLALVLFG